MVPPCSHRVSRVRRYSGYSYVLSVFNYRTLTFFGSASHRFLLQLLLFYAVHTLKVFLPRVWPLSLSLATTHKISFDFSSSAYLDVSVQQVRLPIGMSCLQHDGLPHSEIRVSELICSYARLIAACHVLLRLQEPWHPPCALGYFT